MKETLGFTVELPLPFDDAMRRTRAALQTEGFGVLTEIDMRAAFREKLGKEFRPYVILGACNPPLAFRALSAQPEVGLLLPCNVTVEESTPSATTVRLVNPTVLLAAGGEAANDPTMREVAADASGRIARVATALRELVPSVA